MRNTRAALLAAAIAGGGLVAYRLTEPDVSLPPVSPILAAADFDRDGDVDGTDSLTFINCFNGSNRPPKSQCTPAQALLADLDSDADVDGPDYLIFSVCFNGAARPARGMDRDDNGDGRPDCPAGLLITGTVADADGLPVPGYTVTAQTTRRTP